MHFFIWVNVMNFFTLWNQMYYLILTQIHAVEVPTINIQKRKEIIIRVPVN
jgi:hypothetical protein